MSIKKEKIDSFGTGVDPEAVDANRSVSYQGDFVLADKNNFVD